MRSQVEGVSRLGGEGGVFGKEKREDSIVFYCGSHGPGRSDILGIR